MMRSSVDHVEVFQININNYQLIDNSPCIDSGINYFEFNNGASIEIISYYDSYPDMGAYEFLSSSIDCAESLGDVNNDGVVDILDISIYLGTYL